MCRFLSIIESGAQNLDFEEKPQVVRVNTGTVFGEAEFPALALFGAGTRAYLVYRESGNYSLVGTIKF